MRKKEKYKEDYIFKTGNDFCFAVFGLTAEIFDKEGF
jgi:hypothetical protein